MPEFVTKSSNIMKNTDSGKTSNLFLEAVPLSLMETEKIKQLLIENQLYLFSVEKLIVFNKMLPANTLLFSTIDENPDANKPTANITQVWKNIHSENGKFYSSVEGFFILEDNLYSILPVRKDASFLLEITKDAMSVKCSFYPPAKGYKNLSLDEILLKFKELKITATPDVKLISKYLKMLETSQQPFTDVEIARGTFPQPGKEGWVEYLVKMKKEKKNNIDGNQRVDFYNMGTIITVEQDEKLAIVHPPIPGKAGVDVLGRPTKPEPVKKAPDPKGTHTYYREEEPNVLLSDISGYLTNSNGKLNVTEKYNVKGNVDFHTGNISSKGALNVNGDVRSGFKLDIDKSITINGFINDAEIKSQGTITINGGFGGSGKGKITAAGDVKVRHIRNQTVNADGDIIIMKEAVDAKLYAKGSIKSMAGNARIIGGTSIAEKDVEIKSAGNEFGVKTRIHVGLDYALLEKSLRLSLAINEMKEKLKKKEIRLKQYSNPENLSIKGKRRLKEIISEYQELKNTFEVMAAEKAKLDKIINMPSESKVKITGDIYPGVEIVIKKTVFKVTDKLRNKTFTLNENEEMKIS